MRLLGPRRHRVPRSGGRAQAARAGHDVTCVARGDSGEPVDGVRFVARRPGRPGRTRRRCAASEFDALIDVSAAAEPRAARAVAALADRWGTPCTCPAARCTPTRRTPGQRVDDRATPRAAAAARWTRPASADPRHTAGEGRLRDRVPRRVRRGPLVRLPGRPDRRARRTPLDRFGYWVRRIAAGGEVLAPGRPGRPGAARRRAGPRRWLILAAAERAAPAPTTASAPADDAGRLPDAHRGRRRHRADADLGGAGVPGRHRVCSPWDG